MRLIEVDTGTSIEAPAKLQPAQKTLGVMCKLALETARAVHDLSSLKCLLIGGASIVLSDEVSPARGKAVTDVSCEYKKVIVRLPQEVHERGVGEFDPDLWITVANHPFQYWERKKAEIKTSGNGDFKTRNALIHS